MSADAEIVITTDTPDLLVVGGAMRSGTTLLRDVLASHPRVKFMALELRALAYADLATWAHVAAVTKHFTSAFNSVSHRQFRRQVSRYLSAVVRGYALRDPTTVQRIHKALSFALADANASYVGDKYPNYVLQYPKFIHQPNTRCVFAYRDARDVVASLVERVTRGPWRHRRWARRYDSIEKSTAYWLAIMQALQDIQRLESNVVLVRYEDLVLRTNETIAIIARHLDLPEGEFDVQLPDPSSIGRYRQRLGREQVETIEHLAKPTMQAWGYV
jgi:sulfotransferase family protein